MRIGYGRKVGHGYVFVSTNLGHHTRRVHRAVRAHAATHPVVVALALLLWLLVLIMVVALIAR